MENKSLELLKKSMEKLVDSIDIIQNYDNNCWDCGAEFFVSDNKSMAIIHEDHCGTHSIKKVINEIKNYLKDGVQ